MSNVFQVRWPRWRSSIAALGGAALLYVLLDIHFLGFIPGATASIKHEWLPNLFLGALGLGLLGPGLYYFARPPLLLVADPSGIRLFRALGIKQAKSDTSRPDRNAAVSCIPWNKVLAMAAGKAYWSGSNDSGPTVDESQALLIACDPSVALDGFRWVGDAAIGFGPAATEECALWPNSRINGHADKAHLVLNAKYLPCPLTEAVQQLSAMQSRYRANGFSPG